MNISCMRTGRRAVLLGAGALALGLVACGTAPPAAPVAQGMREAPDGTVTVFHRTSTGSLGSFDGKVEWVQRSSTWQGRPMRALVSAQAGTSLHDPEANLALVANLAADGRPLLSYSPPLGYAFPLSVGQRWSSSHVVTSHASGATTPVRIDWRVESWGDVTVPAGTFKAYRIVSVSSLGERETRWVSPQPGLATLKREVERSGQHPLGAGTLRAELLSLRLPAR